MTEPGSPIFREGFQEPRGVSIDGAITSSAWIGGVGEVLAAKPTY
jgi:hypothetical protein